MEIARNCGAASKSMKKTLLDVATASESPLREKKLTSGARRALCDAREARAPWQIEARMLQKHSRAFKQLASPWGLADIKPHNKGQ